MKTGIIGAGAIGYNLAKKLAPHHEVRLAASKMSHELIEKTSAIGATAVDRKERVKDVDMVNGQILALNRLAFDKNID